MSEETLGIVTNRGIIALNQDALGIQGFRYKNIGQVEIWVKPLVNDAWAFCFFNHGEPIDFTYEWEGETVQDTIFNKQISFTKDTVYQLTDLYAKKELGTTNKRLKKRLKKNQSLVVRVDK
jgi:alpha-galactosidase